MMENQSIEIRLEADPLGRKFRFDTNRDYDNEGSYPCHGCASAIWNIDHFCCRKLDHGWNEWDEFYGEDVFPFKTLYAIAQGELDRNIDYSKEGVIFYGCSSRN